MLQFVDCLVVCLKYYNKFTLNLCHRHSRHFLSSFFGALQCVTVRCNLFKLQCAAMFGSSHRLFFVFRMSESSYDETSCCHTHCSTLKHTGTTTHYNTLNNWLNHCNNCTGFWTWPAIVLHPATDLAGPLQVSPFPSSF